MVAMPSLDTTACSVAASVTTTSNHEPIVRPTELPSARCFTDHHPETAAPDPSAFAIAGPVRSHGRHCVGSQAKPTGVSRACGTIFVTIGETAPGGAAETPPLTERRDQLRVFMARRSPTGPVG